MPQLRAAVVSELTTRKRKRKEPKELSTNSDTVPVESDEIAENPPITSTNTIIPTNSHDGGKKARRGRASTEKNTPALIRRTSSTAITTDIPWPAHFTRLNQTFKALNLVFTFCCTRKHLATTFDNIKGTVEGHIKRPLTIEDVAQIKALVPRSINFAYVDEAMLQVYVLGADDGIKNGRAKEFHPIDTPKEGAKENQSSKSREVLLFEYIDGDLKRQVQHAKTGEPTRAFRKLREEDLKMPVYSQKQMMTLISKRNAKFTSAINGYLNQCAQETIDPVEKLGEEMKHHIPALSDAISEAPKPYSRSYHSSNSTLPDSIPHPDDRKSIPEIIAEIKQDGWYTDQIVPDGHRVFDPQPPIYGELDFALSQNLVNALFNTKNITQLYSHQAEAINALHQGRNVIVATSTSSGKSLIYQVPVLHELERDSETRAMYIFPTKALAQDQRRSLKELLSFMPSLENTVVETFDGDTPMSDRNLIRDEGRIIFTNPDMLHITILPKEEAWRTFLKNLKYVVVDELHVYNGLFGSHIAFIMRRLRRICAAVGNRQVKFISCSATVANPVAHMSTIFGLPTSTVQLIDFDGSPSGRKEFICWNTPFKDPQDPTSGRGDALAETARLFTQLILRGTRVIAFCRVRKQCEALVSAVSTELTHLERAEVMARVMGYRGGYTAQDRRKIEREMFEGKLVGIIATNALELGVDIGGLDVVITVGFPYTISNLRQQSGRAGRRCRDSLSVLVGDCFPTDQHYMSNPDEIFTKPNIAVQVDLDNMLVLEGHIQCAAFEMPIRLSSSTPVISTTATTATDATEHSLDPSDDPSMITDEQYFGPHLPTIARERLSCDAQGYYHTAARFRPLPSRHVSIRDTEDGHFAIINVTNALNTVLEEIEPSRAYFTIYEGGIYLHQGVKYLVKYFSPERHIAKVERVTVDWTTQQRDYTDVDPIETEAIRRIPGSLSRAFYGIIKIRKVVFGFFKVDRRRRILDAVEVDNPPIEIFSKGMWLDVPRLALDILNGRRLNVAAAIHAAEHALLSLLPNFVMSMPGDVRTECKNELKETQTKQTQRKRPARLTFYDTKGGAAGSGISTKAFEFVDLLLSQAEERVRGCACEEGCLECVASEGCKEGNRVMSKVGAGVVLKVLLGKEVDVESLPWGDEDVMPAGVETVIMAEEVRPKRGERIQMVDIKREERSGNENDDVGTKGNDRWGKAVIVKEEPVE